MKQFDLQEYLKHPSQKVVTRDGRNVRIICTNYDSLSPIIAEIEGDNVSHSFRTDGRYYGEGDSPKDLFFAPIKEEGWVSIYKSGIAYYMGSDIFKTKEEAEENGKKSVFFVNVSKIDWTKL